MKAQPKYSRQTREIAQYGHELASLLWRKALVQSSPEVRELLLAYIKLRNLHERVLPCQDDYHINHEMLLEAVHNGETLLTGFTPAFSAEMHRYLDERRQRECWPAGGTPGGPIDERQVEISDIWLSLTEAEREQICALAMRLLAL